VDNVDKWNRGMTPWVSRDCLESVEGGYRV